MFSKQTGLASLLEEAVWDWEGWGCNSGQRSDGPPPCLCWGSGGVGCTGGCGSALYPSILPKGTRPPDLVFRRQGTM